MVNNRPLMAGQLPDTVQNANMSILTTTPVTCQMRKPTRAPTPEA